MNFCQCDLLCFKAVKCSWRFGDTKFFWGLETTARMVGLWQRSHGLWNYFTLNSILLRSSPVQEHRMEMRLLLYIYLIYLFRGQPPHKHFPTSADCMLANFFFPEYCSQYGRTDWFKAKLWWNVFSGNLFLLLRDCHLQPSVVLCCLPNFCVVFI